MHGVKERVINGFLNSEFIRIWKVEVVFYPDIGRLSRTVSIGTNGKLTNSGAKAFIKAKAWDNNIHYYTNELTTLSSIAYKGDIKFDIIEIYEIKFDK